MNAEQRIQELEYELKKVRAEAAQLRQRVKMNGRHAARVEKAYEDALKIAGFHVAFLPISRDFCREQGISQRRWENARALLLMARVYNGRRFTAHDLATIETALERARKTAINQREAFTARLPRHLVHADRRKRVIYLDFCSKVLKI